MGKIFQLRETWIFFASLDASCGFAHGGSIGFLDANCYLSGDCTKAEST